MSFHLTNSAIAFEQLRGTECEGSIVYLVSVVFYAIAALAVLAMLLFQWKPYQLKLLGSVVVLCCVIRVEV